MKKVLYFDVEWANSKNRSICQIGLLSEDFDTGEPVLPELNIYIDPEDSFDRNCMAIHKITPDKVKGCRNFKEIWTEVADYFINSIIIGHNVKSSDLNALVRNLKRYNIDIPELWYIDTYLLARQMLSPLCVNNYELSTLCKYFSIDIDSEHDAFDDACACSDLLRALLQHYEINIDDYTKHYLETNTSEFSPYTSSSEYKREINQLYGVISGFEMDDRICSKEKEYLTNWEEEHKPYKEIDSIKSILMAIDSILSDGIVTMDELNLLKNETIKYLQTQQSSKETLATQYLQGLVLGIKADEEIQEIEIYNLQEWLYKNNYLEGHYPYDKLVKLIEKILKDNVITKEEKAMLSAMFEEMFNPLERLKEKVIEFEKKEFCLSGNFLAGSKKDVEGHICSQGGVVHKNVRKGTDYVVVGSDGSDEYTNGTYGLKVKKAMELGVSVIKEEQLYK